jgi:transcriptional regulator with XRE-family HTH domain
MSYNDAVVTRIIRQRLDAMGNGSGARVARQLGVRPQTVSKWRSGENTPKPSDWPRVAVALGLDKDHFHRALFEIEPADVVTLGPLPADEVASRLAALEAAMQKMNHSIEVLAEDLRGTHKDGPPNRRSKS